MKKSVGTLLSLFLLSAFTSCVSSEVLFDTDGELLKNGGTYLIIPASGGEKDLSGISLAATGNDTCPVSVVTHYYTAIPVAISSMVRTLPLAEGYPIFFRFVYRFLPLCVPSPNYWTVMEESAVKVHESLENGFFTIKKVNKSTYKIMFGEKDIGVQVGDDKVKSLVVTEDKPLEVVFKKVDYLSFPSASA